MITIILFIILNQICGHNLVVFMLKTLYSCHFLNLVAWRSLLTFSVVIDNLLFVDYRIHTYRSITCENHISVIFCFSLLYMQRV